VFKSILTLQKYVVSCNIQYLFELHLTNSKNSYQSLYLAIVLHIQSNMPMEKVRNWDREAHQKETYSNEWVYFMVLNKFAEH
jgi:hypothetical protein